MNEFFQKLKNMNGVTHLELRHSNIHPKRHLYVTVSIKRCTSNEVEDVQLMLHEQKWFQWTFNLVP